MTFIICTNNEILSEGTCFFETDCGLDVHSVIGAAVTEASKDGVDVDLDSDFRAWRGGRYAQHWNVCGFVAIPRDADKSAEVIAWRIHEAITAEIAAQERLEQESA